MLYFASWTHPPEKQITSKQESQGMIRLAHPMACPSEKMVSAIEFSYRSHFFQIAGSHKLCNECISQNKDKWYPPKDLFEASTRSFLFEATETIILNMPQQK